MKDNTGRPNFADPTSLPIGMTVYLYPNTKTTARVVHERKGQAAKILVDATKHWPYLIVGWAEGNVDKWAKVHRYDLRTTPASARVKADEKVGDGVQSGSTKFARVRKLPGKPKEIDIPEGLEQGELF